VRNGKNGDEGAPKKRGEKGYHERKKAKKATKKTLSSSLGGFGWTAGLPWPGFGDL